MGNSWYSILIFMNVNILVPYFTPKTRFEWLRNVLISSFAWFRYFALNSSDITQQMCLWTNYDRVPLNHYTYVINKQAILLIVILAFILINIWLPFSWWGFDLAPCVMPMGRVNTSHPTTLLAFQYFCIWLAAHCPGQVSWRWGGDFWISGQRGWW